MNALTRLVLSVPCPRCRAAAGESCRMSAAEWAISKYPWHYERWVNRPLAQSEEAVSRRYREKLSPERRAEIARRQGESQRRLRRERLGRVN